MCLKYLLSLLHEVAPNSVTLSYYLTTSSCILWVKSSVRVGLLKPFPFFFLKKKETIFILFILCVCFSGWGYPRDSTGVLRGRKRVSEHVELELEAAVS